MDTNSTRDLLEDDPTLPLPGRRTGAGSSSILPYLIKTLASKPGSERSVGAPAAAGAAAADGRGGGPGPAPAAQADGRPRAA